MPIVVGLVVMISFVVSFSEWFYQLVRGLKTAVLDDMLYVYRIFFASMVSIAIIIAVFVGISIVNECPSSHREGWFATMRCDEYLSIKAAADNVFQIKNKAIN